MGVRVGADVAVMVSGNAMAHLYLDVRSRTGRARSIHGGRSSPPAREAGVGRPRAGSVGQHRERDGRGARLGIGVPEQGRYLYRRLTAIRWASDAICAVCHATTRMPRCDTDYPDSVVQIVHLALAPRSGEIILSAARDWDFRARYEPIPHVSSHGALHREHMLVPLLVNHPVPGTPRRTVDVMPSALAALGKPIPAGLDGASFL